MRRESLVDPEDLDPRCIACGDELWPAIEGAGVCPDCLTLEGVDDEPPARCAFCAEEPAGGDGFCSDECARGANDEVGVDQRVHEDLEAWS